MKYLCLIYDEEAKMANMSEADANAFMGEYFAFTEAVKKSGHYVAGEALKPVNTATTVRMRNGKMSTTDGPFAETKDVVAGYFLILADSYEDAVECSKDCPHLDFGTIEIRRIQVV